MNMRYEEWRHKALREKPTIRLSCLDDFERGPRYLVIRIYRLRLWLRHWKPLLIRVQWYSDKAMREIYEDGGIFHPGWVFRVGEPEYRKWGKR